MLILPIDLPHEIQNSDEIEEISRITSWVWKTDKIAINNLSLLKKQRKSKEKYRKNLWGIG